MRGYKKTSAYIYRKIAGQSLLFPVGEKADELQGTIVLNEVSKYVWDCLEKPISYGELVEMIQEEYDVEGINLDEYIIPLIEQFKQFGVIEEKI